MVRVMTKFDKIKLFREIFKGREDVVPRHWISAKTGRSGYSPICRNEWQYLRCQKRGMKVTCAACENKAYMPLSDSLIYDHFMGKHILGVYPLFSDNTCYFIAADFDNHKKNLSPLHDIRAFYEVCQLQEIPCYILRSKSGTGYHAFIFFEGPVPARKARVVIFALLQEAEVIKDNMELSSFDRLFPNQDKLSGKGFGNLIALPFQGKAAKNGHTLFLNPDSGFITPYKNQWDILAGIQKNTVSVLDDLISEWNLSQTLTGDENSQLAEYTGYSPKSAYPLSDFQRVAEECAFIAHCRDDAKTLSEPDWYILLTIAARCKDGRQLSHKLSEPYPEYTPEETEAKIRHALDSPGPYCCRTIQRINGRYCKTCKHIGKVKSPIVLGRKKTTYQENTGRFHTGSIVRHLHYQLTSKEKELIGKHYKFYRSLDKGSRIPRTEAQKHFQWVCQGQRHPSSSHERAYLKYKKIQAAQKPVQYGYPEIQSAQSGVRETILWPADLKGVRWHDFFMLDYKTASDKTSSEKSELQIAHSKDIYGSGRNDSKCTGHISGF
ncbi:DUF413 [Desulfonema magnum]|uniref:Macrodomain Ori protein n=2 Tax=Desulfonema magnum TaxID=45655 RepID=A0A975GMU5_9BACT|nr:DUF413 [Desulfonema magnum]